MLDLKRLLVFREVARRGSFSEAADALNYSQPAVSHHVSRLELELGAKLVQRGNRAGVTLTDVGRVLLVEAEALLDRAADAEQALAAVLRTQEERVRLGAFATASATIVAWAISAFRRSSPGVHLSLREGEAHDTLEALRLRQIDIGLVFDDPRHPLPGGEALKLSYGFDDPMLLALPDRHPLAERSAIALESLRREQWIEGAGEETPCSLMLIAACAEAGFRPEIAFNSGNFQVVGQLVASGVGVALVPWLALQAPPAGVAIRPLAGTTPHRRIAVATRASAPLGAPARAMVQTLERSFAHWAQLRHRSSRSAPSQVH